MISARGRPLVEIETWIFDLDNTLYPASCRLFDQIHARMTGFIADRLGLTPEAALTGQKSYFREHGTAMRGLMTGNRIDPEDFLAYVHEIDLSCVPPDPVLVEALTRLPGRKVVHTNGSQRHAERRLAHAGIARSVSGVRALAGGRYEPNPALAGYNELLRRHQVSPGPALMVEDMARNLVPAAALGMTTAWVRNSAEWAVDGCEGNHVHHIVDDLGTFLTAVCSADYPPPR